MNWSVFSVDLEYVVHKIYEYRVKSLQLLVTEITPILEQTQHSFFQAREEEMVKRWERGNRKWIFLWMRAEMTGNTTVKSPCRYTVDNIQNVNPNSKYRSSEFWSTVSQVDTIYILVNTLCCTLDSNSQPSVFWLCHL